MNLLIIKNLTNEKERVERRLTELSVEIGKGLNGESAFTTDVLTLSINSTKDELRTIEQRLTECEQSLTEKKRSPEQTRLLLRPIRILG